MWKKKIRKNKWSFLLIAIIILITVVLLSTACIFITCIDKSIVEYYDNPDFPDVYMYNSSEQEIEQIKDLITTNKINNFQKYSAVYASMNISKKRDEIFNEDRALVISINDYTDLNWKLTLIDGTISSCPNQGEIWISKIFADKKGLQLGDIIEISTAQGSSFKISAIINDSQNASLANPAKIMYINFADILLFDKEHSGSFVVFQYADSSNKKYVIDYIQDKFYNKLYYMEKDYLVSNQLSDTGMVSVFLQIAGILSFISVVIVINFTLKNNLMKESKSIGTYKALGFTKNEIKKIYSTAYFVIGIISTVVGVLISFPLAYFLQEIILQYLDKFGFRIDYIKIGIIIIVIFNFLIQIIVNIQLKKINRISPVEAFEVVNNLKNSSKAKLFKNPSSPITLAVNDILKDKRLSVNVFLVLLIYTFTTLFFISIDNVLDVSNENANIWLNLHKTNATINMDILSNETEKDLVAYLDEDENVSYYGYGLYLNAGNYIKYDFDKYGDLSVYAIESFSSYDNLGFDLIEGRYPEEYNEINVSFLFLNFLGLNVGDQMTFKIYGIDTKFNIVGSFGSIKYGGYNVRMLNKALSYYGFKPHYNTIAIQLKDSMEYNEFKENFENKFPVSLVQKDLGNYNELMNDMTYMVPKVVFIIVIFMFLLCALNTISIISIIMFDERRSIGIYKALGFTGTFIKIRMILRIAILALFGVGGAVLVHSLVSKSIIGLIITSPNAIIFSNTKMLLFALLIFVFMLAVTVLSLKMVNCVRTIELMEE